MSGISVKTLFPQGGFLSVGVDGCPGKWAAVAVSDRGFEVGVFDSIEAVCVRYGGAGCVLIDIPLGLAESAADLRPDGELRKLLGRRGSSVFPVPCRQAVYASGYGEAAAWNRSILAKSFSKQTEGIRPKIREADEFLRAYPDWKNRLMESHPEYCFAVLNGGEPILENKHTQEGEEKRLALLERWYPVSRGAVERYRRTVPRRFASHPDDAVDALVLAVMGALGLQTGFRTVPERPMEDRLGVRMQIVTADLRGPGLW